MARDASDYMSDMKRQDQEYFRDLDAFFVYTSTLVKYLTRFVEGLHEHRDAVWCATQRWDLDAIVALLVHAAQEARWQEDLQATRIRWRCSMEWVICTPHCRLYTIH